MKRIDFKFIASAVVANEDAKILLKDAVDTIAQADKLEKELNSTWVLGNRTLSVEAKFDEVWTKQMIDRCYDIARYDCIEALNELLGGNTVDMTGTDKQVCRRFYFTYHKLAAACRKLAAAC